MALTIFNDKRTTTTTTTIRRTSTNKLVDVLVFDVGKFTMTTMFYIWCWCFFFLTMISSPIGVLTDVLSHHHPYMQGQSSSNVLSSYRCPLENEPKKKLVCFYRVEDEYRPYDLDPCLCTHIVYSYVAVKENFAFIAGKKGDLKYLSALRNKNPLVKIIVSLRPTGPAFSLEDPKNITYPLPPSNTLRHRFAKRIRDFVNRHSLDGVDIDYEYFKMEHNSNNQKRQYLISIIQSISESLKMNEDNKTLLTLTTSRYPKHLADYYDFAEINKFVDFVNIPAFNFDQEGHTLIHPAKLHGMSEMENMDAIIDLALALGLPSNQLIIGIPTFGTLYRMANQSQTTPGSKAISWTSNNQPITTISHSKICDVRDKANWTLVREKDLTAPYIYSNDKWIGFDDEISIKLKAKYIVLRRAAGMAFFHLNDDDFQNQCGLGPYPLLRSALSVFNHATDDLNQKIHPVAFFNTSQQYFTSFLDVVQKYGNVERITDEEEGESEVVLPCNHNGYMRHPEDCTRFYRCLKLNRNDHQMQKFQYSCPPGLVFDEYFQICNWPSWSPTCLGSGEIASITKPTFICKKQGFFQDPENCEYFHYCSDLGKTYLQPYQFKCPFELGFDQEKLQCNWKWLVKGCQYVPPEERIVKDIHQILPQDAVPDDKADQIQPAASEISAIFQDMFRAQQASSHPEDEFIDEFEERSDNDPIIDQHNDPISAMHPDPLLTHPEPDTTQQQSKLKRFSLINLPKIEEIYKKNPSYIARLQAVTNYISNLMSRLRYSIWNPNNIKSRSDQDPKNPGKWRNHFNRMIPKFPSLKKPASGSGSTSSNNNKQKRKTPSLMVDETALTIQQQPPQQQPQQTKNKKKVFDKNSFKVPRLNKFSKRKRVIEKPLISTAKKSANNNNIPLLSNGQQKFQSQIVPMFVEESIHIPDYIQSPTITHFRPPQPQQPAQQPTMNKFMHAESSLKPMTIPIPLGHNQFNHPKPPPQNNANLLNNYRLASSMGLNTFPQPHQFHLPSNNNQQQNHQNHNSNNNNNNNMNNNINNMIKESKFLTTKPPMISVIHHSTQHNVPKPEFSKALKASESVNNFNIETDSNNSPIKMLPSEVIPFTHSYGLPSVNIRYSYLNEKASSPKPQIIQRPPTPEAPIKIEATKINFPETILTEDDVNSADLQLENFLRDKFISSLNIDHKNLQDVPIHGIRGANNHNTPTARPKPIIQTPTTRAPVIHHTTNIARPQVRPQAPKITTNQINNRAIIPPQNQPLNSAVTGFPVNLNTRPNNRPILPQTPKPVNKFANFINADLFANERDKFFKDVNNNRPASFKQNELPKTTPRIIVTTPKPKLSQPLPAINYKLTPITDSVFEINNKPLPLIKQLPTIPIINPIPILSQPAPAPVPISQPAPAPIAISQPAPAPAPVSINQPREQDLPPKKPSVHGLFDNYDPHIHAHNVERFELVRSTPKPQIKFESYEWTTPSSLKDNKLQVNFNLMSAKDIEDEMNKKKHIFNDEHASFKPVEQPLPYNKHNFFPPLGDVFQNYATSPETTPRPQTTESTTPAPTLRFYTETQRTTPRPTSPPWVPTKSTHIDSSEHLHGNLLNDTNEYIMLMLNKDSPEPTLDHHLAEILHNTRNLGKVYNVESDGAQTILALLPNKINHPFVYKGEDALLKNMTGLNLFGQNLANANHYLKLDISKPDSEILHSIFDRVKDELHATGKLLPYAIEDIDLSSIPMHQPRRIPQPVAPVVTPDRHIPQSYNNNNNNNLPQTSFTKPNYNYRTTTTTTTTTVSTTTTTVTPPTTTTTSRTVKVDSSWIPPHNIDHDSRIADYAKINRSSNVWYQDVPRITDDLIDTHAYDHGHSDTSSTPEEPRTTTIRQTPPTTAFTRSFTYPTTATTTTTTTTTESSLQYQTPQPKPQRRPNQQGRRRPDFGQRQKSQRPQMKKKDQIEGNYPAVNNQVTNAVTEERKEVPKEHYTQNHFGQKLNNNNIQRFRTGSQPDEASATEKTIFYEEELPGFSELNYPETQNIHNPATIVASLPTTTTTTEKPTTEKRFQDALPPPRRGSHHHQRLTNQNNNNNNMIENTYYPESTIHNLMPDKAGIPESACTRPGIFQHPNDCNKYYECYWDKHINKFTLHPFECPVKLAFDSRIIGCASPNDPTVCVQY